MWNEFLDMVNIDIAYQVIDPNSVKQKVFKKGLTKSHTYRSWKGKYKIGVHKMLVFLPIVFT